MNILPTLFKRNKLIFASALEVKISRLPETLGDVVFEQFKEISKGLLDIYAKHAFDPATAQIRNRWLLIGVKDAIVRRNKYYFIQSVIQSSIASKECKHDLCDLLLKYLE